MNLRLVIAQRKPSCERNNRRKKSKFKFSFIEEDKETNGLIMGLVNLWKWDIFSGRFLKTAIKRHKKLYLMPLFGGL